MNKKRRPILILILLFIVLIFAEYYAPKELDWRPTFSNTDKIPYGTMVFYNTLDEIFPDAKIEVVQKTMFETIGIDMPHNSCYMIVTEEFDIGEQDIETLCSFVEGGNKAFISATRLSYEFMEKLEFEIQFSFELNSDTAEINFVNPNLKNDSNYLIHKMISNVFFTDYPAKVTRILGVNKHNLPNFIRIKYGTGYFFIHTVPVAFSNFNMLKYVNENNKTGNADYAFKSLSYIGDCSYLLWDEYYKPFSNLKSGSPLRYILSQKSLRMAYLLLIVFTLIYFFFEIKRVQRIIPIIEPHKNTSLEFVRTIGRLYFQKRNNADLLRKKFMYFSEYIRSKYYLNIQNKDIDYQNIADNTGVHLSTVKRLMDSYKSLSEKSHVNDTDLLLFNSYIQLFISESK